MTPSPHGHRARSDQAAAPGTTSLVLFDLDGTLADSAPDLVGAVNACLRQRGLEPRPLEELRPWASHGARGLIGRTFGYRPGDAQYEPVRAEFLDRYEASLFERTTLFPGVDEMLVQLETAGLRWGIVTNKVARLTQPLVRALGLEQRAACVVSGDTAARPKPDPAPILYALAHCACGPEASVYVGDDRRDIEAGRAAGVRTIAAAYGYSAAMDDIAQWQADHIVHSAPEVLRWVLPEQA
jgi:phosphoglycolate phosphatase